MKIGALFLEIVNSMWNGSYESSHLLCTGWRNQGRELALLSVASLMIHHLGIWPASGAIVQSYTMCVSKIT